MRVFIVSYSCSVIGVYTSAVDANQIVRMLRRIGSVGAVVCEARLNDKGHKASRVTLKSVPSHSYSRLTPIHYFTALRRAAEEQEHLYLHHPE